MSALAPIGDKTLRGQFVRDVPIGDMHRCNSHALFDHVVCGAKQLRMKFEAERLGGLEVDHELELGGLHDRQVARLLALENPPGLACRPDDRHPTRLGP